MKFYMCGLVTCATETGKFVVMGNETVWELAVGTATGWDKNGNAGMAMGIESLNSIPARLWLSLTVWVKKTLRTCGNFSKTIRNFSTKFYVRIVRSYLRYRLRIFIQLSSTLTKLCHIKRDHPVHIMCAKCPPSAKTHAGIFWHFFQTVRNF